jgi:acetyl-CoA decarbonylase/synthase complex subunit gamma
MTSTEGEMPGFIRVGHQWTADEWWSAIRCRLGRFGTHSRVPPGLYALGRPNNASPVLVTASYRLSFDLLRRDLEGIDGWILVLDTRGLGVGTAAASGRFGTDELVTRVTSSRLARAVSHRTLILPARASAVIDTGLVARSTGFEVRIGPVRTSDLPGFLGAQETPAGVGFSVGDALALIPAELGRSLMWYPGFAFAALLYAGLGPGGVTVERALAGSWTLLVLGLGSVFCGSCGAPILRALFPRVPLWVSGGVLGCAAAAALLEGARLATGMNQYLTAACALFFPAAAAVLAERFSRALPDTGQPHGPGRAPFLLPLAAGIGLLVAVALVLSKLDNWRASP